MKSNWRSFVVLMVITVMMVGVAWAVDTVAEPKAEMKTEVKATCAAGKCVDPAAGACKLRPADGSCKAVGACKLGTADGTCKAVGACKLGSADGTCKFLAADGTCLAGKCADKAAGTCKLGAKDGTCKAEGGCSKRCAAAVVKPQTMCPIMGGKINKDLYVDYKGKRVYVCCDGCVNVVKKDPAKYIKQIEAEGITVAKAINPQTICPIMGGKVNKALYVDHKGKRVYVCCAECVDAVKKDPAKYIKKLEAEGITVAKAINPQTTCPIMGGKINKALYVDHKGKRVYVCCAECVDAVKKDPAKYIEKLEAEGITLAAIPSKQGQCGVACKGACCANKETLEKATEEVQGSHMKAAEKHQGSHSK